MRREGRVRGKNTNKSRLTGRCRSGKTRCRSCRDHPVEKSREKRMGRYKRFAVDVCANPALVDFVLQPSLRHLSGGLDDLDHEERLWFADQDAQDRRNFQFYESESDDETTAMVGTVCELASGAENLITGDATDIGAIELAFQKQLSIVALSEESWSDVELAESDKESSAEDVWSLVDVDEDGVRE